MAAISSNTARVHLGEVLSASIRTARRGVRSAIGGLLLRPSCLIRAGIGTRLRVLADLVLCAGLEILGSVALVQLLVRVAERAVDHAAALHGGAGVDLARPGHHVLVFMGGQER